ncbi:putative peptidase [Novosphingobium subterraneum]|uniref:Putative peptidase n=2 Tax=Sphingomonadaceae TaxID=41297 RepID=A0A0B9A8D6_9SPHN|nr:putative peptidase [Novosphingobium subterraneum]
MHRFTVLFVAIVAFATSSSPALAERPVADFAHLPMIEAPSISPNGKLVVAMASIAGKQELVIIKADGGGLQARLPVKDVDVRYVRWVNDEWLIATVGVEIPATGGMGLGTRLIAFRTDGSDAHFLIDRRDGGAGFSMADVLWVARDGSPRILLASQTSFYLSDEGFWPNVSMVDVATNTFSKLVWPREGVQDWYADRDGNVRLGIGIEKDGLRYRALYRASNKDNFDEFANVRRTEELIVPDVILADGSAIAFSTRSGTNAAYKLDLKTMQVGEKLFDAGAYDMSNLYLDKEQTRVLGYGFTDTRYRTVWIDEGRKKIQAQLEANFPGKLVRIVSLSRDEKVLLFKVESPSAPGAYYVFEAGQPLTRLALENPTLGTRALAPVKTVAYKARDGMDLTAVLTLPAGVDAKNLPVIVMPHGGPAARDDESWDWWAQFLADRGYAVIQPNFRGSSGFGTAFQQAGAGQWGYRMQDDVDDALAYLGKEGIGDVKRACVVGGSYGGYVAMRAAERNPDLYRCAISYAGVADLPEMIKYDRNFVGGLGTTEYWRSRAEDLSDVSPINHASRTSIPILVIHGKKDRRVPFAQSKTYVDRLKKAGKAHEFFIQPEGDHFFSREEDRLTFLTQMEAFLDKHNPAN